MKIRLLLMKYLLAFLSVVIFSGCDLDSNKKNKKDIKIAAVLPLTGNTAAIGEYSKRGLELAIYEQNSKGGLLGDSIVLINEDSKGDPKQGGMIAGKLFGNENKPLLVYSLVSGVTMNIKPITEKNKAILISCIGSNDFLKDSKYSFRNFIDPKRLGSKIIDFFKDTLQLKKIGILYVNNVFGKSYEEAVNNSCIERKISPVFIEAFSEDGKDFKNIIARYNMNKVDAIYIAGVGQSIGIVIKQLRESGYKNIIIGDANLPNPSALAIAKNYMQNVYVLDFDFEQSNQDKEANSFRQKFTKRFKSEPENFSRLAYNALKMYFQSVDNLQTTEVEQVVNYLNKSKFNFLSDSVFVKKFDIEYPLHFYLYDRK